MFEKIKKRDGRVVGFDADKIVYALRKAGEATGEFNEEAARALTLRVVNLAHQTISKDAPWVEDIQDIVEEVLLSSPYRKTAKAYIIYRDQHARIREIASRAEVDIVDQYLDKLDWQISENSNMSFSLQGLNNYISSEISKVYWLNKVYPPEIRSAHLSGDMHLHDLNILSVYCVGWDLQDLLSEGFKGVVGKVESGPAKHFRSALGQVVNFFYTLQGEAAGAQAFANFDTLLAPFIRYDNLGYREVKQALQEFVFNINVPTRVGFQTPFTNITMDLKVPSNFENEPVVAGGEIRDETYGEFQKEMDTFNRAFLEVMLEGDARGRVFTFPIPTYNIAADFDWDNADLDLLWKVTGKYGIPYFSNFVNSDMSPEDARSMCPLAGKEKVLIMSSRGRGLEFSSIRNVYEGNSAREKYWIYSAGEFVPGRFNRFQKRRMMRVTLANNHTIEMSREHLNFAVEEENGKEKVIPAGDLKPGMHLPYSLKEYKGQGGNRELGYFVGAYAGDGSFDGETCVVFSLSRSSKKQIIKKIEEISVKYFGARVTVSESPGKDLLTLRVNSRAAAGLCRDFVAGKERGKYYRARLFGMSMEFREGVVEGHYAADGGNRNRIYTSSPRMVETLNMLAATMGTATSVYKDGRKGRLGEEPNFAVLFYQLNRKGLKDTWFKKGGKLWMKIKSIENISNTTAYCFEVDNGEPVFTVGTTGILTHNCRLRLDNRELRKRGGGLFGANPLTGSIGVVTVNLPRIGYLAENEKDFMDRLSHVMELARESLEIKRKLLEKFTERNLYPYAKFYLRNIKLAFNEYWKNHFSTVGIIGMNEACRNLFGENIAGEKGSGFAVRVMDFMREKLVKFQEETENNYNLEATPAEGTSYRLALKDRERYPDIICAGNGEAEPFYTNSTQLPVEFTDDLFEVLDLQDEIQTKYTGGTVVHLFIGEQIREPEAVKKLVRKICGSYRLPYFTFTPTFSVCPVHGYISGEHRFCPRCEVSSEVYTREIQCGEG